MSSHTPQVVVQITGGLGNQIFQYAMGRRLALANGVPLVLDHLSGFPRDFYKRTFLLDKLNVQCGYISPDESYVSMAGRVRRRIHRYLGRLKPLERRGYVMEEDELAFDRRVHDLKIARRVYFEGYWQHEEYFRDAAEKIREDLTPAGAHDAVNREWAERIRSVNAVALHVRRLHYVPDTPGATPMPENERLHIGMSYYTRAIEFISGRLRDPHFFVFSDFPQWARENLKLDRPIEYVTHNGPDVPHEDLWLMTQCRHFVIANSTFSWWGAWLARSPEKIITAPRDGIGKMLKSVPPEWHAL